MELQRHNMTNERINLICKYLKQICTQNKYPLFFVDDFVRYQIKKNWTHKNKPLNRPTKIFTKWCEARKSYLKSIDKWIDNPNEWDFSNAVFIGLREPTDKKNELLLNKVFFNYCKDKELDENEKKIVKLSRMESHKTKKGYLNIFRCKCGYTTITKEKENYLFCPLCCKNEIFDFIKPRGLKSDCR